MIAADINLPAELAGIAICLSMIFIGRWVRGALGGVLIAASLVLIVAAGVDSAIKLFGTEWSFLERLYHFACVWLGIGAAALLYRGFKHAHALAQTQTEEKP